MIWYLSFADETFRGAVLIHADTFEAAYFAVSLQGINPGGEVFGFPVPEDKPEVTVPGQQWFNRLLSREDVVKFWPDSKSTREFEEDEDTARSSEESA